MVTDAALNLTTTLDRFAITRPEQATLSNSENAVLRGLYHHENRYYAPVGERWFEVAVEDTGDVSLIDTRHSPVRRGPALISNTRGEWFIDTRLRLRGGGLSSRRKAVKQQNGARIIALKNQLSEFDNERKLASIELTNAHKAMQPLRGDARLAAQTQFMETLERRTQEYAAPIEQLKSLNLLDAAPNYRAAMVALLDTQLFLNQTWLDERNPAFAQTLRETLALMEADEPAGVLATAQPTEK